MTEECLSNRKREVGVPRMAAPLTKQTRTEEKMVMGSTQQAKRKRVENTMECDVQLTFDQWIVLAHKRRKGPRSVRG